MKTTKEKFCVDCSARVFPISVRHSQTLRRVTDRFYCFSCDKLVEARLQNEVEKLKEKIFKVDKWVYKIPIMINNLNKGNREFVISELIKLGRVGDTIMKGDTIIKREVEPYAQQEKFPRLKGKELKRKMPNFIFRENPKPTKDGRKNRNTMLEYIKDNPLCKRKDLTEYMGYSSQTIIMYCDEFIDLKKIKGLKDNNSWYYYHIQEDDLKMGKKLKKISDKKSKEVEAKRKARLKALYNKRKIVGLRKKESEKAIRLKGQLDDMKDEELIDMDSWLKGLTEKEVEKEVETRGLFENE